MTTTRPHLSRELEEAFRSLIHGGEWPKGQKIPSESALQRSYGASRGTVRKALDALRADGLIYGSQGRTPVVRHNSSEQSAHLLGSFTAWARSAGRTPGQRTLEVTKRAAGDDVGGALQVPAGELVVFVRRLRLLDGEPAMLEDSAFAMAAGRHLLNFDTDSGSIYARLAACGAGVYTARHTLEAVPADAAQAEVLDCRPGAPLLRDRRIGTDCEGRIVEYSMDSYLSDRVSLTLDNQIHPAP
ncbi:GntR family transcriptional regulator [Rothia halotolerans]|uniref:GntR family transcriptional regulator n=1 Tax=Rothia halotolerans TaxID=405770 RepID=UPI00101C13D9|nr:GntR family transcriptional regulator [Rothia halotolerans]